MDHYEDVSQPAGERPAPSGDMRWGLRHRLLGAFLVVALMTVGVGIFGIQRMSVLSDQAEQVYDQGAQPLDALRTLQADWWQYATDTARANIPTLPAATIAQAAQNARTDVQKLQADIAATGKLPLSSASRTAYNQFTTAVASYLVNLQKLIALPR